jgi:ASC-1-like (ASCH) protein
LISETEEDNELFQVLMNVSVEKLRWHKSFERMFSKTQSGAWVLEMCVREKALPLTTKTAANLQENSSGLLPFSLLEEALYQMKTVPNTNKCCSASSQTLA